MELPDCPFRILEPAALGASSMEECEKILDHMNTVVDWGYSDPDKALVRVWQIGTPEEQRDDWVRALGGV